MHPGCPRIALHLCLTATLLAGVLVAPGPPARAAARLPQHGADSAFAQHHRQQVRFVLRGTFDDPAMVRRNAIARTVDWRSERRSDGIGWELGSAARGDGSVMSAAFTVVQPARGQAFSLRHCYVLAAFDLVPSGILVVAVRDPEYYWQDYDPHSGLVDPVDLVWYSEDWQEQRHLPLDFNTSELPDDFVLGADGKYLLAVRHPVGPDGRPIPEGHSLELVWLQTGEITDVWLPEVDGYGFYPAAWQPLGLHFTKQGKELQAQAGAQLRIYDVEWLR
jgi:hypothetical protein